MAKAYEIAAHIVYHLDHSGGASPNETTRELCEAVYPEVTDEIVEIVDAVRNSDGTFGTVVDPADHGARVMAARSKAARY